MAPQVHTFSPPPDATVCTALFAYIVVVFVLARLSIDGLWPKTQRRDCILPSSLLYLACILLWPVTLSVCAGLLILGLLINGFIEALNLSARWVEACRRRITSCFPSRRRAEDLEAGLFVPCHLEGVSWGGAVADHGCSQAETPFQELIKALKKESGLAPEERGRASFSRSLAPSR